MEQLYSQENHKQIIHESDNRNEIRDQLNGTQQIAGCAYCKQSCVPPRAAMSEHIIEDVCLRVEPLRL